MKRPFIAHRNVAFILFIFFAIFGLHVTNYADVIPVGEPQRKAPLDNVKGGNTAPVFTDGERTIRRVTENTAAGVNIGTVVAATDADNQTLTYSLGGRDADAFDIDTSTGQLKTKAALNYETKNAYTVTVTVSDGRLEDSIVVTVSVRNVNEAPVFGDGENTTRQVAENTAAGVNFGQRVSATDPDANATLTYSLGGRDANAFDINSKTGQLKTKAALNYETKNAYTVTVTVSDGRLEDSIVVTVSVRNVNEAPVFGDGENTTRQVAENTAAGIDFGQRVSATDPDANATLTYSLGGRDADAFGINSKTGQLKTKAALDYETRNAYIVSITASDGKLTGKIAVTINVKDVNEAPVFSDGKNTTRQVDENTAAGTSIGKAVAATDVDNRTLVYSLGGRDAAAFGIHSMTGQLQTKAALDYETKNSYTVSVTASDGRLADKIIVTINVKDVNEAPVFGDGENTTRQVDENTAAGVNIGKAVAATDVDNRILVYSLGGRDAAAFGIHSTTGQLQTKTVLDYETKNSYTVTVTASDSSLTDEIAVTINVKNVNEAPVFTDGENTTRRVDENTAAGTSIGRPLAATDVDNRSLVYRLGDKNAAAFAIDSMTGQLKTKAALDYETKNSYTVPVSVSDGRLADKIVVTVNVKDVNEAPVFGDGENTTRQVAENTAAGVNFGQRVSATDPDANATLTYSLGGGDAAAFAIDSTTGQLQTKAALDYETKDSYTVTATVSDGRLEDTIDITINVTDVYENRAPVFTEGTSTIRSVAENTAADENIGTAVSATDPDDDTLTYSLTGTDASSFSLDSSSGQLKTKAALDHETKDNYSVTVSVSDADNVTDSITVTISVTDANDAPVFADGSSITRSVDENTASGQNIGSPISATDEDAGATLIYTLDGTDAAAFSIVSTSGQLKTRAVLNHETKSSYSVTVIVSDGNLTDTMSVSISVTDINEAPVFSGADPIIRAIAENVTSGQNIGSPISATDEDAGTTLTYTLSGTDATAFNVDNRSGRLQTRAALDYETKSSYSVTLTVSDGSLTDTIGVLISISNVNEAPVFSAGSSITLSVDENTASGQNIGSPISATDVDANTRLTYTLRGADAAVFSIVSTSGQLQTNAALDYETKSSYSVTVIVSDGNLTDTMSVSISVTDINEAPVFSGTDPVIRGIAENTISGQNIGGAISATDEDAGTTLTYTLGGTDAAAFSIVSTSGQLQTRAALNYETKSSYAVTVTVSDGSLTDTMSVSISVTDINEAPVFPAANLIIRGIAENTVSGQDIGRPISATDEDAGATLIYTLGGTDASAFSIVSASGQLQTHAALDYEVKSSYSVTVVVSDGSLTDTISVLIRVSNVNETPVFADGPSTTRSVDENTISDQNIGSVISATDVDANTRLTYTLQGTDASAFGIVSTSGQLQTRVALDYEAKSFYSVTVVVSDGSLTDTIDVLISVTDVNDAPVFTEGTNTIRAVAERNRARENIGSAVSATDQDNDPLTYTLEGIDAAAFRIVDTSGQLQTRKRLDYETQSTYFVTVTVSDGNLIDTIDVTINVTDINDPPMFTEDTDLEFAVPETISSGENIGSAVSATDQDNDPLTYTLEGVDAEAFSIVSTSGQLQTKAALDYETHFIYDVSVVVSDGNGGNDRIDVTIFATDVFEATPLRERTPAVMEAIMEELEWIDNVDDVIEYDLLAVRLINMSGHSLTTLKSGDFSGLHWVRLIYMPSNSLESLPEDIFDGLSRLEDINLSSNSLRSLPEDIFDGLSNLENLYLQSNSLESLPEDIFDGLSLKVLDLASNSLTSLPDGLFSGLSNLEFLRLHHNTNGHMPLTASLKKVAEGQFKATIHSGAPHPIQLPVSVTNGSISDGATSIIVPAGQVESDVTLTVTRTAGTTAPVSVNIGTLPVRPFSTLWLMRPFSNSGYRLVKSEDLPLEVIPAIADAPNAPAQVPKVTAFLPNYPNPFNPETWIPYQLAKPSDVTLTIYNMKGNIVRQLALGHKPAGLYKSRTRAAYWDGRNGLGEKVATGVYFCTFKAGEFTATRKMLILK